MTGSPLTPVSNYRIAAVICTCLCIRMCTNSSKARRETHAPVFLRCHVTLSSSYFRVCTCHVCASLSGGAVKSSLQARTDTFKNCVQPANCPFFVCKLSRVESQGKKKTKALEETIKTEREYYKENKTKAAEGGGGI